MGSDLLRLATELERSGGVHRFIALVQAASLVLLRFEHGESVTVRGERWPLPVSDCQDEPRITHAPDSPIHTGRMRKVPRFADPIEEDGE